MGRDVIVVDYGVGNIRSVSRALEFCGATVKLTSDPEAILRSDRIILPGVGAFAKARGELSQLSLDDALVEAAGRGVPLMGICLGMQLLFERSYEFGSTSGLGLIPGEVVQIPNKTDLGGVRKVPHIGWNALLPSAGRENWRGTLLEGIRIGEPVYFLHSFMAKTDDAKYRLADSNFDQLLVSALVERENVYGCQFHPEKSGKAGLAILERFLSI